jgi:hypothetical protein
MIRRYKAVMFRRLSGDPRGSLPCHIKYFCSKECATRYLQRLLRRHVAIDKNWGFVFDVKNSWNNDYVEIE